MLSELKPILIGNKTFDFKRPYIMGVLNITPDSFSDGGQFLTPDKAIEQALRMQTEGADIIDVGGESTRPGSERTSFEDEIQRVIPVIKILKSKLNIPISIDSYKSQVSRKGLEAGADLINDITGLQGDPNMAKLAAEFKVPVVIMHIKGTPKTMQVKPEYEDLFAEIKKYFTESIRIASGAGIEHPKLILDPGIGFGKKFEHNFRIIRDLDEFKSFNLPLLIGASRKSFLALNEDYPTDQRLEQSLIVACQAVLNGANIIRVHDVRLTKKALETLDKIITS